MSTKTKFRKNNPPKALKDPLRFRAAANSVAPSWLIWLFLKSSTCSVEFPPSPSQNTENDVSSIPTAFHSRHKLKYIIYKYILT